MPRFKIANALKGFTLLDDEPMEIVFDRVVRSIVAPLSRPADEVIINCLERERGISGCLDTGLVLADLDPTRGFSSELILGLGVSEPGIRWRAEGASSYPVSMGFVAHFLLVVLAPDDTCRLRTLQASTRIFQPNCEPGRSILGATSLEQAVAILRTFEEAEP